MKRIKEIEAAMKAKAQEFLNQKTRVKHYRISGGMACNLLMEEYGSAEKDVRKNTDKDALDYPYILETHVNKIEGVGRFYLGLAKEIQIVEGCQIDGAEKVLI